MTDEKQPTQPPPVTMQQFKSEVGEFIRAVAREGRSFTLTKNGKPVAMLVPCEQASAERLLGELRRAGVR